MIVPKSNNRFVEQYSRDTPKTIQLPVDKMVYPVQNQGEINQVRQAVDGNAQWISVKVVNAHESQAKKALLFDALGAYTSAKSYTKPAEITVTYPSILKDPFFSLLRSGQKFRIWKVDINQLAPAGSAQMANPLKTYSFNSDSQEVSPMRTINPLEGITSAQNQLSIQNVLVNMILDMNLSIDVDIEPATTVTFNFNVVRIA